jgi:hypothetical protein
MFVAGCHRSGTSYVSSLLSALVGWNRPGDLERTVDNPRGYFESTLLGPLNETLLAEAGFSWDRPPLAPLSWSQGRYVMRAIENKSDFEAYALGDRWVDKDPRLSLTFPFYRHLLLKRVACVVPIRHPRDVAQSLFLRDGFSVEKSCLIWFLYNRSCSRFFDTDADLLLSYEDLLVGSPEQLNRLQRWLRPKREELTDAELSAVIADKHASCSAPDLRRNRDTLQLPESESSADSAIVAHCFELYERLASSGFDPGEYKQCFAAIPEHVIDRYDVLLSEGTPSLEFLRHHAVSPRQQPPLALGSDLQTGQFARDEQIIRSFADLLETLHQLQNEVANLGHQDVPQDSAVDPALEALQAELADAKEQLRLMRESRVWRVTEPLRKGLDRFRTLWSR